jgi:hypothetical protein
MYKRPALRPSVPSKILKPTRVEEGSFLYKLFCQPPIKPVERVKQPVYQKDVYLALLKKNYEEYGLEYKEPDIPDYNPPVRPEKNKEPELRYADQVYMKVRILKSGIIRVKLDASFYNLYERYYSKNKIPPIKTVIQAYKSMGFSDDFLQKIKKKHDKNITFMKKVSPKIDAIFNKETIKKPKKKKVETVEEDEVPPDEDDEEEEEEEEEDAGEDGEMDVEVDEDLEEQPQEDEEVYLSD